MDNILKKHSIKNKKQKSIDTIERIHEMYYKEHKLKKQIL